MMMTIEKKPMPSRRERYELGRSPFSQKPTQRDVAMLLGEKHADLVRFIWYKDQSVRRRDEMINGKLRKLAYPVAGFRRVHERLAGHFNKIKQPSYLFSPRKGCSQRDNAALHLGQKQFLTLDLKQFYPSTTAAMVRQFFNSLNMAPDVAGFLTQLVTIDGKVSFGSPLTPVLCTIVHRQMFDNIADICSRRELLFSVWVDDLTISGDFVPGEVLEDIREVIRAAGLKSHKIEYRNGSDPVFITGIGIVGRSLIPPESLNTRIKHTWSHFHEAETDEQRHKSIDRLLADLGTARYIAGKGSVRGQRSADTMNSLRQKRDKMHKAAMTLSIAQAKSAHSVIGDPADLPFDL